MAVMGGVVGVLMSLMLIAGGDSLLPMWIFATSLTLLVHTVLLCPLLPVPVFIAMKTMLSVLRLDFWPLESSQHAHPPSNFYFSGYDSTQFVTNMGAFLLAPFALCFLIWLVALTSDLATLQK